MGEFMSYSHITVLLNEAVDALNIKKDGTYIDATLGGGGHFEKIKDKLSNKGLLIGIDQDEEAIINCKKRFSGSDKKIIFVQENFKNISGVLENLKISGIDGVVMDLGVSSHQLDTAERGFSYMQNAPLDMRMNKNQKLSAFDIINNYDEQEIYKIIKDYGEERFAKKIAGYIARERQKKPILTTFELSEIIKSAIPASNRREGPHPAKRTFQAIRIAVNDELDILTNTVFDIFEKLNKGGRISIITFHSLEDRIIKNAFINLSTGCICPPKFPACVCGKEKQAVIITKKPIVPSEDEINKNPRSRSAKLRVIEKIV